MKGAFGKKIAAAFIASLTLVIAAELFREEVGEFVLLPGMILNGFIELLLVMMVTDGNSYLQTPAGTVFGINVVFYWVVICILVALKQVLPQNRKAK